jgi:Spy/CpxP family protein refolding chaperone
MKAKILVFAVALFVLPQSTAAQDRGLEAQLRPYLAPPELVMRYQRQLNITAEQRQIISEKVGELQAGVLDLQWQLEDANQTLIDEVSRETIDVDAAISQFDRMLEIETSIKRHHIRTLLEIRNVLSLEQRSRLQALMEEMVMREMMEHPPATRRPEQVPMEHKHGPAGERPARTPA